MSEQEILDNAPDGATSYSAKQKQYWDWPKRTVKPFDSGHLDIDYPDDLRSLADIARIAELEKQLATAEGVVLSYDMSFKERDIRDLEQQISAVKQLISNVGVCQGDEFVGCYLDYDMVIDELNELEQAKQLREGEQGQ